MCDIVFEKVKVLDVKVNKTSGYAEAEVRRVPLKACHEKFCRINKKTSVPESLF